MLITNTVCIQNEVTLTAVQFFKIKPEIWSEIVKLYKKLLLLNLKSDQFEFITKNKLKYFHILIPPHSVCVYVFIYFELSENWHEMH